MILVRQAILVNNRVRRIRINIFLIIISTAFFCAVGYSVFLKHITLSSIIILSLGGLFCLTYLTYINIRWKSYSQRIEKSATQGTDIVKFRYGFIIYAIAITCTILLWQLTPESAGMPKWIYFHRGGAFYFVFLKIGLVLFDIAGFIALLYWNEIVVSPKKHCILFLFLWLIVYFAVMIDPRF